MKNSFPSVILSESSRVILSKSSRVILSVAKNLAMLSIAAVMFVACGGDNGSSARDEDSSSSHSELVSESASSSSEKADPEIPQGDKSSSSSNVKESSSEARSSSSTAKSSSSSRVILSSGEESSSSAKSSSSSAKSSSSSVKISSSSEYVPFDHSKFLESSKYNGGAYKQFTDERNGRSYYYITITGKDTSGKANTVTVMAENLNIGEMVDGFDDQSDDAKIERYCYNDDTTYCDKYGGLYQWAEMMALPSECNTKSCADLIKEKHQGICPTGWRLQTYNDMYTIVNADGNNHDIKGVRSEYRFSGYNTTGYSLVGAGCLFNNRFIDINNGASWYYVSESTSFPDVKALASGTTTSGTGLPIFHYAKTQGFSVRCVMVE